MSKALALPTISSDTPSAGTKSRPPKVSPRATYARHASLRLARARNGGPVSTITKLTSSGSTPFATKQNSSKSKDSVLPISPDALLIIVPQSSSKRDFQPDDAISEHASVSQGNSNYFTASHADTDGFYQQDYQHDLTSPISAPGLILSRNASQQGESMTWFPPTEPFSTMDELAGVGNAHHADRAVLSSRNHDPRSCGTRGSDDDWPGFSLLSIVAAAVSPMGDSRRELNGRGGTKPLPTVSLSPCDSPSINAKTILDPEDCEDEDCQPRRASTSSVASRCESKQSAPILCPCRHTHGCNKSKSRHCDMR